MSTAKFDTLQNVAGTKSVPVSTVVDGSAKAWVNFNGTGTVAIRGSFNVSSITDNGTGDYTINLTTALADTNGTVAGSSVENVGATGGGMRVVSASFSSTSAVRAGVLFQNGGFTDCPFVGISVFR